MSELRAWNVRASFGGGAIVRWHVVVAEYSTTAEDLVAREYETTPHFPHCVAYPMAKHRVFELGDEVA